MIDCLQQLLDNSTTPAVTAFLLGILTALSPCPLATNIAAIGYISKEIEERRAVFVNGLLYTLGRVVGYASLGIILIQLVKAGTGFFGIQQFIAQYGELLLGPLLLLIGLYMLYGSKLPLPSFGFKGRGERVATRGGIGAFVLGVLFALSFCPTSGLFYFGMLIPLSCSASMGYLLPVLFAVATALPVILVSWILAFAANRIGQLYGRLQTIQKWLNVSVGILFTLIGIYYTLTLL